MGHDTHPVQGGLPVEEHDIVVPELAFDRPAGLDHVRHRVEVVRTKAETPVIGPDNVVCTAGRVNVLADRAGAGDLPELLDVVGRHADRDGHLVGYCTRDAYLRDGEVRIRGDDGTAGKVHTLTR